MTPSVAFSMACGFLLLLFAAAKLLSATGSTPILLVPEPVFDVSNRTFMMGAGLLECVLGLAVLRYSRLRPADCLVALACFCASAWLYRYAFYQADPQGPCPCLGTVTQKIGISSSVANVLALGVLIFMSTGSVGGLVVRYIFSRRVVSNSMVSRASILLLVCSGDTLFRPECAGAVQQERQPSGLDAVVRIEGSVSWMSGSPGKPLVPDQPTRFAVVFDRCTYRIEESGQGPGLAAQSLYYNGTNWHYLLQFDPGKIATNITRFTSKGIETVPLKSPAKAVNPSTVTVAPMLEPLLPNITSLLPVWLAFGGGCYFKDQTAQKIPPIYFMGDIRLHPVQRVSAERAIKAGGMFLSDYTDYWDAKLFPVPQPECSGLTNIAFWVTGWTNLGAMDIPLGFRFLRYFFSPDTTPRYYQSMDVSAIVDRVDVVDRPGSMTAHIQTNTYVIHHPAMSLSPRAKPVAYFASDARLKPQAEVNAMVSHGAIGASGQKFSIQFFRVAVIALALVAPAVFLVRKWRMRNMQ